MSFQLEQIGERTIRFLLSERLKINVHCFLTFTTTLFTFGSGSDSDDVDGSSFCDLLSHPCDVEDDFRLNCDDVNEILRRLLNL